MTFVTRTAGAVLAALLVIGVTDVLSVAAQSPARFELARTGNEARYRVREQFVGVSLPNDAVGVTTAISGGLAFGPSGEVVPAESKFVVDLRSLTSDSESRDRAIHTRVLETEAFPRMELVVRRLRGLPFPLPASGRVEFELDGDLTLRGQTRPSTWQVVAEAQGGGFTGRAITSFTFGAFGIAVPTSFRVLSVEDLVRLEYDFRLVPAPL